jgi:hypothetical protein
VATRLGATAQHKKGFVGFDGFVEKNYFCSEKQWKC